jgi:hypothetical protein
VGYGLSPSTHPTNLFGYFRQAALGGCPRIALAVIPVKTGIQKALIYLDARFRGHDDEIRSQFSDSLLESLVTEGRTFMPFMPGLRAKWLSAVSVFSESSTKVM